MIYLNLFLAYLQVGLFSIGGGHASIPITESVIVNGYGYLTEQEFSDMITISETTPGPFGINSATFVGLKVGGFFGGVISTLAFLIPSFIICTAFYFIMVKFGKTKAVNGVMLGVKPAVSGLIASAGIGIFLTALFSASSLYGFISGFNFDLRALVISALAFIAVKKFNINSVVVILLSGILGLIIYSV
ncbi:MAG: chromate transporter [Clostridia bacterium]|nr:chromate transporter [Clostridia bacterium]